MDANRFDAFARALSLSAARRGMVAGLLGGGLAPLLVALEGETQRRANQHKRRHDELAAEKRKKCKKKKRKKCKRKPKPRDEAPPCTEHSCPLPPGCSQQAFDECAATLIEAMRAEVEACRPDCEGGDSPTCRTCLEPVVAAHLPAAEQCVAERCSASAPRTAGRDRAKAPASEAVARLWWERLCGKPTCC